MRGCQEEGFIFPIRGDPSVGARTTVAMRADDVAIGDFDGDGLADLAVGGAAEVAIWLGPLPAGPLSVSEAALRLRGRQYPDDAFGAALDAADADGDGWADLAIGAPAEANLGAFSDRPLYNGRAWRLPGGGL